MKQKRDFLKHFIPDRIRLVCEDKDPEYIYVLLEKHFLEPITDLKNKYKISIHFLRREITISSSSELIAELVEYLYRFQVNLLSVTPSNVIVDLDDFIRKIY